MMGYFLRAVGFAMVVVLIATSAAVAEKVDKTSSRRPWREYVRASLDTLIERGKDRYGPVESPMLMAVIDLNTLESPARPELYDSLIRLEGRIHRRGERGSNLWEDQPLLRTMYQLSKLSGDNRYARAADAYFDFALRNCQTKMGFLFWGSHCHWDCYEEKGAGDLRDDGVHEILIHHSLWEDMYRLNPEVTRQLVDNIWKYHIQDKNTGMHNRHNSKGNGDFPFSGGSFCMAFSTMYRATGEQHYLDKARLVADWHWNHRDKKTNIPAAHPATGKELNGLYGRTFLSSLTGPHAAALLRCYEITNDKHFRDIAVTYLKAYDKYGWDEKSRNYLGMINLDGTPTTIDDVPIAMRSQVVGQTAREPDPASSVPPIGPVDVWPTTIFTLDFPLMSAQSAVLAYELTAEDGEPGDAALLRPAKRWADVIERNLPAKSGWTFRKRLRASLPDLPKTGGTYAGNYGRVISFYVHLYRATDNARYLDLARQIAQDAVDKLYVETELTDDDGAVKKYGLFRGHAAKPYYETVDGVGTLLFALLELDNPDTNLGGIF